MAADQWPTNLITEVEGILSPLAVSQVRQAAYSSGIAAQASMQTDNTS